jgi:CxxC motif-containing protein (DUF1111 family)
MRGVKRKHMGARTNNGGRMTRLVTGVMVFGTALVIGVTTTMGAQPPEDIRNESDASHQRSFEVGRQIFRREFTVSTGLGPQFNAVSCAFCHRNPMLGGGGRAGDTLVPWEYTAASGELGEPRQRFVLDARGTTRRSALTTELRRRTPSLFGVGQLEAIPIEQLRLRADPSDVDNDDISGRLPWRDECFGRFGWQSTVCDIRTFVVGALNNELGIASFPRSRREISTREVADLAGYVRDLPPPPPPTSEDGAEEFDRAQCASCHAPVTGIATIAGKGYEVKAYTDLLLHEMGRGLRTGERDSRTEFRTAALWGLGGTAPYLHDGSASTVEQAILRHGGEASEARRRFRALGAEDRQRLLRFVSTR